MATKQTSIFNSFIITATGIVTLGLITMYFGYYRVRIQGYQQYIAELQSRPTPEIALTYSVAEQGAPVETEPVADESTMQADQKNKPVDSGEPGSDLQPSGEKVKLYDPAAKPSLSEGTAGASPSGRKARTRPPRKPKQIPDEGDQSVQRGPAFPRTRTNPADDSQGKDVPDNEAEEPQKIPDIDDPELDDNPLIRALREASQRQAENPDAGQSEDPPQNPFEAILNIQDN